MENSFPKTLGFARNDRRQGKWKLVRYSNADWELYDLDEDRTELDNLAEKHPGRVKQMADAWESWLKECKA